MGVEWYRLPNSLRDRFLENLTNRGLKVCATDLFIVIIDEDFGCAVSLKYADPEGAEDLNDVCGFFGFNVNIINRRKLASFEAMVETILIESGGVRYAEMFPPVKGSGP